MRRILGRDRRRHRKSRRRGVTLATNFLHDLVGCRADLAGLIVPDAVISIGTIFGNASAAARTAL
jgi:hypothetical protein